MTRLGLMLGLTCSLLAGCAIDPKDVLDEADIEVTVVNASDEGARVDVTLNVLDESSTTRQAALAQGAATLFFFGLPAQEFELFIQVRNAEGEAVQCLQQTLVYANRRQSLTLDLGEFGEPCNDEVECDEEPCDEEE